MREWKQGEVQAIGAAAKLMIIGGAFVALYSIWLQFDYSHFVKGLPGTLVSGPFVTILIASVVFLSGCALGIWLYRLRKKTGLSTRPFDKNRS